MWKSFTIGKKIWLSLAILVIGYSISMVFGFTSGQRTERRLYNVSECLFPAATHSQKALTAFSEQIKLYKDAVMVGDADLIESAQTKSNQVRGALQGIALLEGLNGRKRQDIRDMLKKLDKFTISAQNVYVAMSNNVEDVMTGFEDQSARLAEETEVITNSLTLLSRTFRNDLNEELSSISRDTKHQRYLNMIIFCSVVFCVAIMVRLVISRYITQPIHRIIQGMNEGAERGSATSGLIASASQSLAQGSSEQAASLENTSASLEEMSSMTKQNAERAIQADNLTKEVNQVVGNTSKSMSELTDSIEDIFKASEETSKIIKDIDEIAFQTNLLALNAAVEAARAGEAGAGFAVVANEVRTLALRTADAAKNTAELIEGTVKKVNDGSKLLTKTNGDFLEVAKRAVKVSELVAEINEASDEQARGIEQVNMAVAEMDKVIQQNASSAEENASASNEMRLRAEQMKSMVNELIGLVAGATGADGQDAGNHENNTALYILENVTDTDCN